MTNLKASTPARTPKYFRKEGSRFLFEMRLSDRKGHFVLFPGSGSHLIVPMRVRTEAEAQITARRMHEEVLHLQQVAALDSESERLNTPADLARAVETWLWVTRVDKLLETKSTSSSHTRRGVDILAVIDDTCSAISDYYGTEAENGAIYLTPFGAALYERITEGKRSPLFTEALNLYINSLNGSVADSRKSKSISDAIRWTNQLIEVSKDIGIDKLTRGHVTAYIHSRLQTCKSTTVRRELNTLSSIWNHGAREYNLNTPNPFSHQTIPNEGEDADKPSIPTLEETITIIQKLINGRKSKYTALLMIIILTGLRNSEAWGILDQDVDYQNKKLHIQPNELRNLKTPTSTRVIPIVDPLNLWIKTYLKDKSRPSSPDTASAGMTKLLRSMGLTFTPHSLRHGMRDRLVELRATEIEIDELLGWSGNNRMNRHYGGNASLQPKSKILKRLYKLLMPVLST